MADKIRFDTRKIIKILLMLSPFLIVFSIRNELDNDTYWLIKTGEYISNNGIPFKDFLTIHTNMDLVCQQWLSSVIFYKIYSTFGQLGLYALVIVMFLIIMLLIQRLFDIVSSNYVFNRMIMILIACALCKFAVLRPQIFTYTIVLIEVICLEKYVRQSNWKYLLLLPVLSALEVNLHASMWTMLFIIMLPFFANALPIKFKGKNLSCCKLLPLITVALVSVLTGLITPYGTKGISFIFTSSLGNKVNNRIDELSSLNISASTFGYILISIIPIVVFAFLLKKQKDIVPLRYILLTFGTTIMEFKYVKLIPYFLILGFVLVAYMLADQKIKIIEKLEDEKFNHIISSAQK